jgi:transposase InsO family protein
MEQRIRLLEDYDTGAFAVSELCARYGVSRETFYAWRARRVAGGEAWFMDRSHAPGSCPHRTSEALATRVLAVRGRFPHFGPKKIRAWLEREEPRAAWPAASTMGDLLKRAGLIKAPPRRRRRIERGPVVDLVQAPNAEWCCDFKGWFRTRDGRRCDPLTITDAFSRYLVDTRIAEPSIEGVKPVFEAAFHTHGLPQAIRCDNGSPFGSRGAAGLTRLSVWWLRLGIEPHFITPASPQENGRHERMHRTLKAQTARPPAASLAEQQARFDDFRRHYNTERPHEALGQAPPDSLWRRSSRVMPQRLEEPWYDADHQVRRVRTAGEIKWRGQLVFIGVAFVGQLVGLIERDDGGHGVRFCDLDLGVINRQRRFLPFAPLRHRLREGQEDTPKLSTINPV